jgi:hypothetical protein
MTQINMPRHRDSPRRSCLLIVLGVLFRVGRKILGHVSLGVNRVCGANRNAGATINAVYRVNEELLRFRELRFVIPGVDAIHGTNFDAFLVFCATFNNHE